MGPHREAAYVAQLHLAQGHGAEEYVFVTRTVVETTVRVTLACDTDELAD